MPDASGVWFDPLPSYGRKAHLLEDKQNPNEWHPGWALEEIHVTWAHLEKKRTRLRTYTKSMKKYCLQNVETASQIVDPIQLLLVDECARLDLEN
ncbi:hypothetical protein Tco_0290024 [Tanacetum coccineum]